MVLPGSATRRCSARLLKGDTWIGGVLVLYVLRGGECYKGTGCTYAYGLSTRVEDLVLLIFLTYSTVERSRIRNRPCHGVNLTTHLCPIYTPQKVDMTMIQEAQVSSVAPPSSLGIRSGILPFAPIFSNRAASPTLPSFLFGLARPSTPQRRGGAPATSCGRGVNGTAGQAGAPCWHAPPTSKPSPALALSVSKLSLRAAGLQTSRDQRTSRASSSPLI